MVGGALRALGDGGGGVPGGVALAGFDGGSSARYTIPPLTTAHVPISELGERAVAMLAESVGAGSGRPRRRETLAAGVVVRRSCGCEGSGGGARPSWNEGRCDAPRPAPSGG